MQVLLVSIVALGARRLAVGSLYVTRHYISRDA